MWHPEQLACAEIQERVHGSGRVGRVAAVGGGPEEPVNREDCGVWGTLVVLGRRFVLQSEQNPYWYYVGAGGVLLTGRYFYGAYAPEGPDRFFVRTVRVWRSVMYCEDSRLALLSEGSVSWTAYH